LLIAASTPILVTCIIKVIGWLIGRSQADFNSYQGNSIPLARLSLGYLVSTTDISAKTLINATILGNTDTLLSWPVQPFRIELNWITIGFSILLCTAALGSLSLSTKVEIDQNKRLAGGKRIVALVALIAMSAEQLLLKSLSIRHHNWFSDGGGSKTYLDASMDVTTVAFAIAIATIKILGQKSLKSNIIMRRSKAKFLTIIFTCTIACSAIATMSDNLVLQSYSDNE